MLGIDLVWFKNDLDWYALYNFHVTASRIFRRNQTEARARPRLNAIDMSFEYLIRIGIDVDVYRLAWSNTGQLALFEVRGHPNLARHDGHQRLSHLDQRANLDRLARNASGFRGKDLRIREFQFGLIERGLQLIKIRAGRSCLCLTDLDLLRSSISLREFSHGLVHLRLGAADLRLRPLRVLSSRR